MSFLKPKSISAQLSLKDFQIRRYFAAALILFLAGSSITVWSWYETRRAVAQNYQAVFNRRAEAVESAIDKRLQAYDEILRGGVGLFRASYNVERGEWQKFTEVFDVDKRYPGTQAIGFSQYLRQSDVPAHIQSVQQDGFKDYQVTPGGQRDEYAVNLFVEPFNGLNPRSLGYDMFSEPVEQKAMINARDDGRATLSAKTVLRQDQGLNNQSGFLVFEPIYKNNTLLNTTSQRRAAFSGYVYLALRSHDIFQAVTGELTDKNFAFQIYDGQTQNPDKLLYTSDNTTALQKQPHVKTASANVNWHHHIWTLAFYGSPELLPRRRQEEPWVLLIGGLALSSVLAAFLYSLMLSRAKELIYAHQRQAQKAKDELLELASHQLRTPATVVKQFVGMLLQGYCGTLSKRQRDMLDKAYQGNERQIETINQILQVSKADADRLTLDKRVISFNQLVRQIVSDETKIVKSRSQTLEYQPYPRKLLVNVDESYVRMALENLIDNASKYSYPNGLITVQVHKQKSFVCVSIIDRGVAIEPADIPKLFHKFERINNDLSVQAGGNGLGLYLAQQIARLHGGTIDVKSQLGQGSTFTFKLPLQK